MCSWAPDRLKLPLVFVDDVAQAGTAGDEVDGPDPTNPLLTPDTQGANPYNQGSIKSHYLMFMLGFSIPKALSIISPGMVPTASTIASTSIYLAQVYSIQLPPGSKSNGAT